MKLGPLIYLKNQRLISFDIPNTQYNYAKQQTYHKKTGTYGNLQYNCITAETQSKRNLSCDFSSGGFSSFIFRLHISPPDIYLRNYSSVPTAFRPSRVCVNFRFAFFGPYFFIHAFFARYSRYRPITRYRNQGQERRNVSKSEGDSKNFQLISSKNKPL